MCVNTGVSSLCDRAALYFTCTLTGDATLVSMFCVRLHRPPQRRGGRFRTGIRKIGRARPRVRGKNNLPCPWEPFVRETHIVCVFALCFVYA